MDYLQLIVALTLRSFECLLCRGYNKCLNLVILLSLSLSLTLASFALFGQIQIVSSQFLACSYSLDHKLFSFVSFSHSDVFILVYKFLAFCLKFPFSGRNRGRFCLYPFLL